MTEAVRLAKDLLLAPSRAVQRLRTDAGLYAALRVYAAFLATAVVFYTLKPEDFPPPDSLELPRGISAHGLLFWAKVQAWGPLLTALWLVYLGWFCAFLKAGSTGPRLVMSVALGLLPALPMLLHINDAVGKPVFAGLWLALAAGMVPLLRRREGGSWKPLVSLVAALNAVNLALMPLFSLTVLLRWETGYHALELVMVFWTLGLGAFLLKRLEGISTPRAAAALFLSMLCQVWFVFTAYFLGLVSKDVLKAMMSV